MVQQAGVAPMRVCIFSQEEELCEGLVLDSQAAGYRVEQTFSEPQKLLEFISLSNIDHLVLIDARRQCEHCLKLIQELCVGRPLAIVALAREADYCFGSRAVEAGAQAHWSILLRRKTFVRRSLPQLTSTPNKRDWKPRFINFAKSSQSESSSKKRKAS